MTCLVALAYSALRPKLTGVVPTLPSDTVWFAANTLLLFLILTPMPVAGDDVDTFEKIVAPLSVVLPEII